MTGLYAHQAGVGEMDQDLGAPSYQGHLKRDAVTLPEVLRDRGYRTIMSGKWHLGTAEPDVPWNRGFDRFYGIPQGGGVYFWPTPLARDIVRFHRGEYKSPEITKPDETFYSTDAFTDYAVKQIREAVSDRKPFFLYLPYVAPHFPHQAWERDIQKYLGRYRSGWDELRKQRYHRQVEMGIISPKHPLSPSDAPAWDSMSEEQKTALDRQMAVYAAQIDSVDQNVGKLMETLRQTGAIDNTLVLFLSDNGGQRNGPLGSDRNPSVPFGSRQSFGQYAKGWASLSNTPFRRYKSEEHEGGNATPLIVSWPSAIRAPGRIVNQVGHIIDIVPTCLEAAGLKPSIAQAGGRTQELEGISMLPFCRKQTPEQSRTLFWEHMGNRAVRSGDWKLVALYRGEWELYNLREDRTELHDLARQHPDKVRELRAAYDDWATRCGVLPHPVKRATAESSRK
jgi:arylsulfatase